MRLIDADLLVADTQFFDGHEWHYGYTEDEIKEAPTIDAVEVVHGEWNHKSRIDGSWETDEIFGFIVKCSNCGNETIGMSNYCPNCGARMDGERREG